MKLYDFGINTKLTITIIIFLPTEWTCTSTSKKIYVSNDTFRCENGEQIALENHNDGEVDCLDNTDEYEDPILFFIASSSFTFRKDSIDVVGIFIRNKKAFRKPIEGGRIPCENLEKLLLLDTHETRTYFLCEAEQRDRIFYLNRTIAAFQSIWLPGKNIRALAFDQITSNVYLLQNDRIEICDSKFVFCSIFQSESRRKKLPVRVLDLAFSSEKGLLFWIEERITDMEWCVTKSRRDGTREEVIFTTGGRRNRLVYITIDQISHKLYCILGDIHGTEKETSIHSSHLDGSNRKLVAKDLFGLQTIAVSGGQLFWRSNRTKAVETCVTGNVTSDLSIPCSPSDYQVLPSPILIGMNVVIYSGKESITPEILGEKRACGYHTHSPCPNLCTYVSPIEPVCFCNNVNGSGKMHHPHNDSNGRVLVVAFVAHLTVYYIAILKV